MYFKDMKPKSIPVTCQFCLRSFDRRNPRTIRKIIATSLYTCPECQQRIRIREALLNLNIDWEPTKIKFGYDWRTMKFFDKLILPCATCNEPIELTYRGPKKLAAQVGKIRHKTCWKHTPESKQKAITNSAKYWDNPDAYKLASEIITSHWQNESYRGKVLNSCNRGFAHWTTEKRQIEAKKLWSRPEYRAKLLEFLTGPQRQLMIDLWADESYREHMSNTAFFIPKSSKLQRKIIPILDQLGIEWQEEYKIRWWQFDYYLPEYSILIEVQGNYWHAKPEIIVRDKRKRTFISNNTKYRLLEIWEDEFKDLIALKNKIELFCSNLAGVI